MARKSMIVVTALLLLALITVGATLALITSSASFIGTTSTGSVLIEMDTGEDVNGRVVLPSQKLDSKLVIKNIGDSPCYVRVRIESQLDGSDVAPIVPMLAGDPKWYYSSTEQCYYFALPLDPDDESTNLLNGYLVSSELQSANYPTEDQRSKLTFNIVAEAIQSEYLTDEITFDMQNGISVVTMWESTIPIETQVTKP